jgi:ElaB/YqjD/DUF883 family membrane-anchored ribosome-binding protein
MADKKNQQKLTDINSLVNTCKSLVEEKVMTSEQEAKTIREFIETGSVNFFFDKTNETQLRIKNKKNEEMKNEMNETANGVPEEPGLNEIPPDELGEDNDNGDLSLGSDNLSSRNAGMTEPNTEQPSAEIPEQNAEQPAKETPQIKRI